MSKSDFEIPVRPDTSMYEQLGNLSVEAKDAFREFIDNSYSSYIDHTSDLQNINISKCTVQFTWSDDCIEITDNAYGMGKDDFKRAFFLNGRNTNASDKSRNEYGMGLKYAAMALGSKLKIETVLFCSGKKYTGILDSSELNKTLAEVINGNEEDVETNMHGTKITISNLRENYKFSSFNKGNKLSTLIKNLGQIYSLDLTSGIISISINKIPVTSIEREYMTNSNTGSKEIISLGGTIKYNNKDYSYNGTIGWLKTGTLSDAGISLIQKGRAVITSYRPEAYFGKQNDARQQRIYGEIKLTGDNWPISFTKNGFNWDGELEDLFNKSWFACDGVADLFKRAKQYKAREQNISTVDLQKSKTNKYLDKLSNNSEKNPSEVPAVPATKIVNSTPKRVPDDLPLVDKVAATRTFTYKDTSYTFSYIPKEDGEMTNILYKLVHIDKNEYKIFLNTRASVFKDFKTVESKSLIDNIVTALIIGELSSISDGVKSTDIQIVNTAINEVIKKMGEK